VYLLFPPFLWQGLPKGPSFTCNVWLLFLLISVRTTLPGFNLRENTLLFPPLFLPPPRVFFSTRILKSQVFGLLLSGKEDRSLPEPRGFLPDCQRRGFFPSVAPLSSFSEESQGRNGFAASGSGTHRAPSVLEPPVFSPSVGIVQEPYWIASGHAFFLPKQERKSETQVTGFPMPERNNYSFLQLQ